MWDDRGRGQHPKLSAHLRPTLCLQGNAHDMKSSLSQPNHRNQSPISVSSPITRICSKGSSQSAEPWARVANLLCPTKSYSLRSPGEVCCRWLGPATWKIVRRMQWLDISGYHNLPANLYSTVTNTNLWSTSSRLLQRIQFMFTDICI